VLIRTALTLNQNSFEAIPMSGIMDMAGNALDNGVSNTPDGIIANPHKPGFVAVEPRIIHAGERAPDNYNWMFKISNAIDREAPFIESVSPNLDQEGVSSNAPLTLKMSKTMSNMSLGVLSIDEFPNPSTLVRENPAFRDLADIWFVPYTQSTLDRKTIITLQHRDFGPEGTNFYYFPIVPSSIKSVTQNCMYPGRGPRTVAKPPGDTSPVCQYTQDENGRMIAQNNCVPFPQNFREPQDTGCVQYSRLGQNSFVASTTACLQILENPAVSPRQEQPPGVGRM
jgi:hypothetical protein